MYIVLYCIVLSAAVQVDVFAAGEFGMEAGADLEEGGDAATGVDAAGGGGGDAAEELEQGALAGAVLADDAEDIAFMDIKVRHGAGMWPLLRGFISTSGDVVQLPYGFPSDFEDAFHVDGIHAALTGLEGDGMPSNNKTLLGCQSRQCDIRKEEIVGNVG